MREQFFLLLSMSSLLASPLSADGPVERAWEVRWSSRMNWMDWGAGLGLDPSGNLFVAGSSNGDILTIKYDPEGGELWAARHDGGKGDVAIDAAVDPSGAVIVTGVEEFTSGLATVPSIVTLKYAPDGTLLWRSQEDGISPFAVTVDGLGQSHVIGYRSSRATGSDFLTVKYDPQGNKLWEALFDGGGGYDQPSALEVDPEGNVYVAGSSESDGGDGVVVKYDRNGRILGSTRFGGPQDDRINALLLDPSGDIYATGSSGAGEGLFTARIGRDGHPVWEARRSGFISLGMALALDRAGNLLVAGSFDANFVVVKYDPGGDELWQASLQGPEGIWNFATGIAVDGSGEVTVTGRYGDGAATARYGPDGTELWKDVVLGTGTGHGEGHRLTLDGQGNAFVTGLSGQDVLSAKYAPDGVKLWEARYDGTTGGGDHVRAIAFSAIGDACVAGTSLGDAVTVAFDAAGTAGWVFRYDSGFTDVPAGIAADTDGNLYLVVDSTSGEDLVASAAVSFDRSGRRRWVRSLDPGGAAALAVDPAGDLHLTGGTSVLTTVKLDPEGNVLWRDVRGGEGIARGRVIALDHEGKAYVSGQFEDSSFGTLKYDREGRELWLAVHRPEGTRWKGTSSMAVDSMGNVSIAGVASGPAGDRHVIVKYDRGGRELWAARRESAGGAPRLALDPLGNLYWAGASGAGSVAAKYDGPGNLLWEVRYEGPGGAPDVPSALAVDPFGNAYLASVSGTGYAARMLSSRGEKLWEARFEDGGVDPVLAIGPPGTAYLAGGKRDFAITKYVSGSWEKTFLRGDCDGDGQVGGSVTDAVLILEYNFGSRPALPCLAACDANGDGRVGGEVTDAIYVLSFGFLGGPAPPSPFPTCGSAPVAASAALGCEDAGACR